MENVTTMQKIHLVKKGFFLGAGLTALAAIAAVSAYCFYGSKDALKNRRKAKAWALKAKGEILEKIEDASEMSQEMYNNIVDEVSGKYQALKNIQKSEIEQFTKELKSHWKNISREFAESGKKLSEEAGEKIENIQEV